MGEREGDVDRRVIVRAEEWDALMERLDEPGRVIPELVALIERVREQHG
jgi:uncharacterized protein (DUF1778 family)